MTASGMRTAGLAAARRVADAVLYEGYLLYPYRASSDKNRSRWQFGVLGPRGAAEAGLGEPAGMAMQALLDTPLAPDARLLVHLRFLHLQRRQVLDADGREVESLQQNGETWLSWDEAVECEETVEVRLDGTPVRHPVAEDGGEETEPLDAGSVVRRRWPLRAELTLATAPLDGATRLDVAVVNTTEGSVTRDDATRRSLLGAHLVVEARGASFVSVLDPPDRAAAAAASCRQDRCWPRLGGHPGDTDLLLGLPIILDDYPEVAQESPGALFDATEIDEILSLRVLTMTDAEKAEARATDPLAREIVDRVDAMSPETMGDLHGTLRYPDDVPTFTDLRDVDPPTYGGDAPWWDPAEDAAVDPHTDTIVVAGVRIARGSVVRVHPQRRADAHDMFFEGRLARVTAVLADVDGGSHVALVLEDDPAADLHDAAGRYFYFAPDEIEPVPTREDPR